MIQEDLDVVAPLVLDYVSWLLGHGGRDPRTLLATDLSPTQRRLRMEYLEDASAVASVTAPLRHAGCGAHCQRPDGVNADVRDSPLSA